MIDNSIVTLLLDHEGTLRQSSGALGTAAFDDKIGLSLTDAFAGWGSSPALPDSAETFRSTRLSSPDGLSAIVEILRLPDATPERTFCAIARPDEMTALPVRMQQLCNVGEISCGISHEMNNALTILCGWLDVMQGDFQNDSGHLAIINLLREEAARLAVLSRNLQEVARSDGQTGNPLDVNKLLSEVTSLVRHEMQRSRIELETSVQDGIPCVAGSSGRLKQALLNLLVNARQAMPQGGKITLAANSDNGTHVNLSVQDTGQGIPAELQTRVFRSFFTTKPEGTGIGLAITKKIVEDFGGTIHLQSETGKGARFTIQLPVRSRE